MGVYDNIHIDVSAKLFSMIVLLMLDEQKHDVYLTVTKMLDDHEEGDDIRDNIRELLRRQDVAHCEELITHAHEVLEMLDS